MRHFRLEEPDKHANLSFHDGVSKLKSEKKLVCGICANFDFDREAKIARNLMTADAIVHRGLNRVVRNVNVIVGVRNPEI